MRITSILKTRSFKVFKNSMEFLMNLKNCFTPDPMKLKPQYLQVERFY